MHGDDIQRRFGASVRALRTERGWSQEAFADRAHLHRTYIGAIERGEQNLSLGSIERIATTLGLSLAELFAPFTDRPELPACDRHQRVTHEAGCPDTAGHAAARRAWRRGHRSRAGS